MEQCHSTMDVKRWADHDADRWDRFVRRHTHGTFFHLAGWKQVIERTFGYSSHYYYAEEGGELLGILPLFFVRGLFSGPALISVPFGVYGGLLADSPAAFEALMEKAKALAEELR